MKKRLIKKRLQNLNIQFKEGIMVLSSFLSAGYSVENAFRRSVDELKLFYDEKDIIVREFACISQKISMNQPVEKILLDFAERSGLDDIKNFSSVFQTAKRSGGDLVAIIAHTSQVIHDKVQVQEEILTLTASRHMEQRIMNLMPFLIICYIELTSPGFFYPIYHTFFGKFLMSICLAIYIFAFWLSEKILSIEI